MLYSKVINLLFEQKQWLRYRHGLEIRASEGTSDEILITAFTRIKKSLGELV